MSTLAGLFTIVVEFVVEFFQGLKGERFFRKVEVRQPLQDSYKAVTNRGSHIEIFCKEIEYCISYSRWWVPDEYIIMYHVYCTCSDDTNQVLKDKLSEEFVISQFLHPLSSRVTHKKAVINSYVDLILSTFNDTLGPDSRL